MILNESSGTDSSLICIFHDETASIYSSSVINRSGMHLSASPRQTASSCLH